MADQKTGTNYLTSRFIGYDVYKGLLEDITLNVNQQTLINTINQYSYCMAELYPAFKNALAKSAILLPDGIGVVLAIRMISGDKLKKIAGADIHFHLLDLLNASGGSCFYLGSTENALQKIGARIHSQYPNIKFGSYSPPYKSQFSDEDNDKMHAAINAFKPDVLFVGMTAPKQETWAYEHRNQIDAKIICSIGAVFDFFAGTVKRPSKFWVKLGLEWFIRLAKEPKRMSRRYLYYGPVFVKLMLEQKFNRKR
ncbi:WecB/TagA/CpsF family glycosyltransferase [Mucilaginibacter sp. HMF5004]|uniref:WecB/TagA/CpsF family glycosyltransferase n=1 Tax=Mucilaginibacter rivuli TaxID=2857527 RepID=UPI001C5E19BA|nr:WecB/TagA/CpsF family glycosyltransferase [Mucilaginibacter rivuli]MBW4890072.1 WecB/TagA/CpsF family glycosyltransferase [Mucilaginibacter rivuli]